MPYRPWLTGLLNDLTRHSGDNHDMHRVPLLPDAGLPRFDHSTPDSRVGAAAAPLDQGSREPTNVGPSAIDLFLAATRMDWSGSRRGSQGAELRLHHWGD